MKANFFYVDKISGTFADTLLATGAASYITDIYLKIHQTSEDTFISDMGPCYGIELPQPLGNIEQVNLSGITLVLPLDSDKQREKLVKKGLNSEMIAGFDYDQAIEDSKAYRKRIEALPNYLRTADARVKNAPELLEIPEPPMNTHIGHYQTIKMMKIAATFNELVQRWMDLTEEQKQLHVNLLLNLFSEPDNDIASAITAWQKMAKEQHIKGNALVTALQIINPTTGKGANRTKARELTIGNQDSFWLLELLKFRGFMDASAPVVIKDSKDRKTYVLQPKQIELNLLKAMMRTLRTALWPSSAVKLDILAALRLTQIFVQHYKVLFERNVALKKWQKRKIVSIAQGFEVTLYKDLGSAYATMNVSDLHLPEWLPKLENSDLVRDAEELLDEHTNIIQHIRNNKGEEGAEEYELLRFYRDFLSGDDLRPFWNFTTAYSGYLMSARRKDRYMPQLTTSGLEKILMNDRKNEPKYTRIIGDDGFQEIANAIREATVNAQYNDSQGDDHTYEIRYSLGQELMRQARYEDDFIKAISKFLHLYNAETAREKEKAVNRLKKKLEAEDEKKPYLRPSVSKSSITRLAKLVEEFGSELVGSLLVAYGYAFDDERGSKRKRSLASEDVSLEVSKKTNTNNNHASDREE